MEVKNTATDINSIKITINGKALRTLGWRNTSITKAPGPSLELIHAGNLEPSTLRAVPAALPAPAAAALSDAWPEGKVIAFILRVSVAIYVFQSNIKPACS